MTLGRCPLSIVCSRGTRRAYQPSVYEALKALCTQKWLRPPCKCGVEWIDGWNGGVKRGFSAFNATAGQDVNECLSASACNRFVPAKNTLESMFRIPVKKKVFEPLKAVYPQKWLQPPCRCGIDRLLWVGCRQNRRCSRDTYPE